MRRWLGHCLAIAAPLAVVCLISLGAAILWRHDFIYPFDPTPFEPQHVGLPRADVIALPDCPQIWRVRPHPGKPVIVYFMGNAGNLGRNGPRIQEFALRGFGLIAMTYRGGGGMDGDPSEGALKADAIRVWRALDELVPDTRRVIYGASLGSGIAAWLAAKVDGEAGLVLETPFTRLCDAIRARVPVPACTLMWDEQYASIDVITQIGTPLLILHGDADRVIPIEQGRALYTAAKEPKAFIEYPGGRHNDLRLHGAGVDALNWIDAL